MAKNTQFDRIYLLTFIIYMTKLVCSTQINDAKVVCKEETVSLTWLDAFYLSPISMGVSFSLSSSDLSSSLSGSVSSSLIVVISLNRYSS